MTLDVVAKTETGEQFNGDNRSCSSSTESRNDVTVAVGCILEIFLTV